MAKISIMGDTVQITSDITKEVITKVKRYAPEALKLYDENDNEVFGIEFGNASCSKYGICFCSVDAEGKLFMTTNNPVLNHSDAEKEREEVVREFAPMIHKLQLIESNVANCLESLNEIETAVNEAVTFVG